MARFRLCAPREPPVDHNHRTVGSMPSSAADSFLTPSRSTSSRWESAAMAGRNGRPTRSSAAPFLGFRPVSSYTVPMKSAHRAPNLLAMPARAFCSCRRWGCPSYAPWHTRGPMHNRQSQRPRRHACSPKWCALWPFRASTWPGIAANTHWGGVGTALSRWCRVRIPLEAPNLFPGRPQCR